jgi:serine/threonine-protein kinase
MGPEQPIGHYRVTAKLGRGGMGEVWRATDTKLNRDVAIKVLPDALAGDPDYLARFVREAQVLAALNHPNIAVIYGVEEQALVMELVPGQTLAERIAGGPIPLEEALAIARQIAEALEAAHEKGIIHRDLKPANVKVTDEGVVKVLDFGLAKATDPVASPSSANSPTLTIRATQAGLILGTAGYMAPEQAAGKPVDRRADIWSFGVVLYELLTGKTLFTGETISYTLASVLKDQIDFGIPQAPPPIRRLLVRCLTRDPKERLRDIGEARIAIREYLANPAAEAAPSPAELAAAKPATPRGVSYWIPRALSAVVFAALAAALAWNFKPSPPLPIMRFSYTLGEGQAFSNMGYTSLAISSDGTQMAYVANRRIYLRTMSALEGRPIDGTGSDVAVGNPMFSPDGKSLAFYESFSQALKRVPVHGGGAALTICPAGIARGASWSAEGIVFATDGKGILRAAANGGQPELLVMAKDNEILADPQMLPGGQAILFASLNVASASTARWDAAQISVQSLKSGSRKVLVRDGIGGRYLPTGHLVYVSNGVLFAVPFNLRRLEITGTAAAVVEGVARTRNTAHFEFSNTGSLIYVPGPVTVSGAGQNLLVLTDRKGEVEPLKFPPGAYSFPRASRDAKRFVYQSDDARESSIWIGELAGNAAPRRLTLPRTGSNRYPMWSSDSQRVAFQSDREGDLAIWWQRADGEGTAERLTRPDKGAAHVPDSWSPDGQTMSFTQERNNTSEVWTYSLRDKKATVFAAEQGSALGKSVFSPDGKWVAYQLTAQPNSRIYVRPFPPTATRFEAPEDQDSHHPAWSPDGKEIFYVSGPSMFGSVTVSTQPSVSFGAPVRAPKSGFSTNIPVSVRTYDVLPDGKHFIGVIPVGQTQSSATGAPQIQVVLNWFEDMKQRVPKD